MKIATFNVNNVNKRLPNLLHWLKTARPDIVCLQELKCTDKDFPAAAIRRAGAPREIDIYPTKSWDDDALVQPESRAAYAKLVQQGWTDALRELNPDTRIYTFWHYMRNRFARDAGLRLDHLLLSPVLAHQLKSARVDRAICGEEDASDHAPVWIELAERAAKKSRSRRKFRSG